MPIKFGAPLSNEKVNSFVTWLRDQNLCPLNLSNRASVKIASNNILELCSTKKQWSLCKAQDPSLNNNHKVSEELLPMIAKWTSLSNTNVPFLALYDLSGTLRVDYRINPKGSYALIQYAPANPDKVIRELINLPVESLIPLLGISNDLDVAIKRRIANPDEWNQTHNLLRFKEFIQ